MLVGINIIRLWRFVMFRKNNDRVIKADDLKELIENYESMDDPTHDLYDISRKLNVIKDANCSFHNGYLSAVNSLLDGMISIDVVEGTKEKTESSSDHANQMMGLVQENLEVLIENIDFIDRIHYSASYDKLINIYKNMNQVLSCGKGLTSVEMEVNQLLNELRT